MFKILKSYLQPTPSEEEMLLEIRKTWIAFFEDFDKKYNTLELPAHERATQVLKEIIESNGVVTEYKRIKRLRGF